MSITLNSQAEEGKWEYISPPLKMRVEAKMEFGYDNNIFKLSPGKIDKFVNNRELRQFTGIKSHDDSITHMGLTIDFNRKTTKLQFRCMSHQYAVNPIKNYQSLSLNLTQDFLKRNFFQARYMLLPQFHIRYYYDNDSRSYERCDFREQLITLKLGRKILPTTTTSIIYKLGSYDYKSYFDEYDTRMDQFGAKISQKLSKDIRTSIEYAYKCAKAKAYDEEGETPLTSDESDISYVGNEVKLDLKWDANKRVKIPLIIGIVYKYENRAYTTKKSIEDDPFHRDRKDSKHTLSCKSEFKITRNVGVDVSYTCRKRDTHSPMKERIAEVKDYTNHIISAGLKFIIDNK